jgi:hypothetical protein
VDLTDLMDQDSNNLVAVDPETGMPMRRRIAEPVSQSPDPHKPLTPQEIEMLMQQVRHSFGVEPPQAPQSANPAASATDAPKVDAPGHKHLRDSWLAYLAAQGVRIGGGLLAAEGGLTGAGISGIAETIAQKMESPDPLDAGKLRLNLH